MRKNLLMRLLLTFGKDANCLDAFELATEHLSDDELKAGVQKCLAMHNKTTLLPADLNRYALSERIENARNTLYKASQMTITDTTMLSFTDLALCNFVKNNGGLQFFQMQDENYFFCDWGKKSFADKFLEIATSKNKTYKRYVFNEENALKNADEYIPLMCFIFDNNSKLHKTQYEKLQLVLREDIERVKYLEEQATKERLSIFKFKGVI